MFQINDSIEMTRNTVCFLLIIIIGITLIYTYAWDTDSPLNVHCSTTASSDPISPSLA